MSQLTNFKGDKSADDFLWNLRMTGQLGSTLLKSKVPENWKAGPNNKGPNVSPALKRERQQAIVKRLEKEFNELVSQSSRTMNQEKRLQNLTAALYAERDALRSIGGSRRRSGGYINPSMPNEIIDSIMEKYHCNVTYECSELLIAKLNDPNLTQSEKDIVSRDYGEFISAIRSSIYTPSSTSGGRCKSNKTRRNRSRANRNRKN